MSLILASVRFCYGHVRQRMPISPHNSCYNLRIHCLARRQSLHSLLGTGRLEVLETQKSGNKYRISSIFVGNRLRTGQLQLLALTSQKNKAL